MRSDVAVVVLTASKRQAAAVCAFGVYEGFVYRVLTMRVSHR